MIPYFESDTGLGTLYHGDCLEIMPQLAKVDLVLTDPPYGIGIASNPVRQKHEKMEWDNSVPDDFLINMVVAMGDKAILWGGNYFNLPPNQCFLVWDKKQPKNFSLSMAEQAWTNIGGPAKMFRQSVTSYKKEHPTQKPVNLFIWCLNFVGNIQTVLDPFFGSGTTGVACEQLGRKWIGIEQEEKYCEIAAERIRLETQQRRLF